MRGPSRGWVGADEAVQFSRVRPGEGFCCGVCRRTAGEEVDFTDRREGQEGVYDV
jgi:hypothetical protein